MDILEARLMLFEWLVKAVEANCNLFPRGNRSINENATEVATSITEALIRHVLSMLRSPALAMPLSGSSIISSWLEGEQGPFTCEMAVAVEEADLRGITPLVPARELDTSSLLPEQLASSYAVSHRVGTRVVAADARTGATYSAPKEIDTERKGLEDVDSLASKFARRVSIEQGTQPGIVGGAAKDESETKDEQLGRTVTSLDVHGFRSAIDKARHRLRLQKMMKTMS